MVLAMFVLKISAVNMRVYLGRRDVSVSQHFLHGNQIGASLEQMRREAVPEGMWRDFLVDACVAHVPVDDLPGPHATQRTPVLIQENHPFRPAAVKPRPSLSKVALQHPDRTTSQRYDSSLVALSQHGHQAFVEG
jgi:hypothetical protein